MPRAIWKGSISFGLVHIPVGLYPAESRPDIQLHMIDSRNQHRVRYERVNESTGKEVPWDAIVKGYEFEEDKFILLSDEELSQIKPEVTKTIEIESFVELEEIDTLYLDKPYYLVPEKRSRGGRKAYVLLRETLNRSGKVGIARVVIRSREYLCALMVRGSALILELLRFPQELRNASDFDLPEEDPGDLKITEKEIKMATQLVEAMTTEWDPEAYEDTYRKALMDWIDQKIEKGQTEALEVDEEEAAEREDGKVVNLMDYLKKSLDEAGPGKGKSRSSAKKKAPARKKSAAKKKAAAARKKKAS